jgi:acyl-lipid omega-6 desaturase (Delta-12 desaturase)
MNENQKDLKIHLSKEVFEHSTFKAIFKLLLTVSFLFVGYLALFATSWYIWPICWLFLGTQLSGLFSIGISCSKERFFSKNSILNRITGIIW